MKVLYQISFRNRDNDIFKKYLITIQSPLILIIISLLISVNSIIGQEKFTIPMNLDMMVPNIEVKINGKGPYRFDFDTGAGGSIVSAKLATDLGLKVIGETTVRSPASDKGMDVDIVRIPEMSISNLKMTAIDMVAMDFGDMLPVDGILSINDFSEYLLTFNYPEEIVQFEKGFLQLSDENLISYGSRMKVEIKVDGTKKNAHLDTGFPGSFAFPSSMQNALSFKNPPVESGTAGMIGTSFKIWKAQLEGDIHLGNIVFESPEIILEDRLGDFITIGYSVIKDFAVIIDQKNSLIKFEKQFQDNSIPDIKGEESEFAGRYGGVRSINCEDGSLYLQRDGGMKLKLESIDGDLYDMVLPDAMVSANKLPKIRFDRNEKNEIYRITFVHEEGREEYALKD